jgi:hypothetical protein
VADTGNLAVDIHHLTRTQHQTDQIFAFHTSFRTYRTPSDFLKLYNRPIPFVWGVCDRKIRVSPISPLPRPVSSLVVQTRHKSRWKVRRASLNTWQARRAFKGLSRSVLAVLSKVVGGPAPATRLIPTFLTAKHAQHQVFLTSLTCMDPQDTG